MLEHDATSIRRPLLSGHQRIEGLWFPAERFGVNERALLILEHWQTGARVYRFVDGDLLRFCQPIAAQCETLLAWPLIRQGSALCSALLTPEEMRGMPAADIWLVRGGHVSPLQLREAEPFAPGEWIDVSAYTLLDTYDCSDALPKPVLGPMEVPTDVREILGGALAPVSPEQKEVMQALLKRRRKASQSQSVVNPPANKNRADLGKALWTLQSGLGAFLILLVAFFWMAAQGNGNDRALRTSSAVFESSALAVVLTMLAGVLLFTVLRMALRAWVRRLAAVLALPGTVPVTPVRPDLAQRATPRRIKPRAWRHWLTRLTRNSRLSALYGKRQAAYMARMLEMFESGDLQEALRHAIPLGGEHASDEQSFGTPQRRDDLNINQHNGPTRSMMFEVDVQSHLRQVYRQTFERLDREGRIEEAVFVLAELLQVRQEALDYLETHSRYQQAADLALAWDMPAAVIVRLLCLADDWQRALQVARRDDAFADALILVQGKWPECAVRLRLEWAEALIGKGLWLQAVDVVWSLPAERQRAAQWLRNAEAAGGRLAIGALVKRAILLPDTLQAYEQWVEQLRDDPLRFAERAALAEALLQHKNQNGELAWLAGATVQAILADQAGGHGRLSQNQLQALVKISKDKLLSADLPRKALVHLPVLSLDCVDGPLQWAAPEMGNRAIHDVLPLHDCRYLAALGEAGAVVVDAAGKMLFHFPVPVQRLVMAHSRQMALALARRDDVWRISKLDLVNRSATDLGVLMLDVFAKSFDGTGWTIGHGQQLRVVDVDRGFATLWHISDLPGRIQGFLDDPHNEYLLLSAPEKGSELWHYRLPGRRLASREPTPARVDEQVSQLFSASSEIAEYRINYPDGEDPVLILMQHGSSWGFRLPGMQDVAALEDSLQLYLFGRWLLVGYAISGQDSRWHFIHRDSDRLCAVLQWPLHAVQARCVGNEWLLYDCQGRLSHINLEDASQRNLSLN